MGNLSRGLQSKIDESTLNDGKIRFALDTARLFIDTVYERIEITDIVKGLTYDEIIALVSPLPKIYLPTDKKQLMVYDYQSEEWVVYGGLDPSLVITNVAYDTNGNTVITYGDSRTVTLQNTTSKEKIEDMESTINTMQESITTLTEAIEILKSNNV